MIDPFVIVIGGKKLEGYTSAKLSRKKRELTGSLTVEVFFTYMPEKPILTEAAAGREILVYVGGHIAFTGTLDRRVGNGSSSKKGGDKEVSAEISRSINKDSYSVTLSARGKTKTLVDASHTHKTTNMLKTDDKKATTELISSFGIKLNWDSDTNELEKVRLRDGAKVIDELLRISVENNHAMFETRKGELKVTNSQNSIRGENLILGDNILSFSSEQGEDDKKTEITVKGQRTKKDVWGKDAIKDTKITLRDSNSSSTTKIPFVVQHYGDATPEALRRRGEFEAHRRNEQAKKVKLDVFHVQSRNGMPWDIGTLHHVSIPPEGIDGDFEVIELEYDVQNDKTLKTSLTLSPPPKKKSSSGLGSAANKTPASNKTSSTYPQNWDAPSLTPLIGEELKEAQGLDRVAIGSIPDRLPQE